MAKPVRPLSVDVCLDGDRYDKIWLKYQNGNQSNMSFVPYEASLYEFYVRRARALESDQAVSLSVLCEDGCDIPMYKRVDFVMSYNPLLALAMGVIGTVLILIAVAPEIRKSSANWYIVALGLTEAGLLIFKNMSTIIDAPLYVLLRNSDARCQFLQTLLGLLEMTSIYILVAMTVERAYVVAAPLKAAATVSTRNSVVATSIVFAVALAFNLPQIWMFNYVGQDHNGKPLCFAMPNRYNSMRGLFAYFYTQLAVITFLPIVVLFVLNALIIGLILKHGRKQSEMSSGGAKKPKKTEMQITSMLVTASVVFLILNIPYPIFVMLRMMYELKYCANEEMMARFDVVSQVTRNFSHAVNAYIYCISSAAFRAQLAKRFGLKSK